MTLEEFRALAEIQGAKIVIDESIFSPRTKIYVGIHYSDGKCLGAHHQSAEKAFEELLEKWKTYEGVTL